MHNLDLYFADIHKDSPHIKSLTAQSPSLSSQCMQHILKVALLNNAKCKQLQASMGTMQSKIMDTHQLALKNNELLHQILASIRTNKSITVVETPVHVLLETHFCSNYTEFLRLEERLNSEPEFL